MQPLGSEVLLLESKKSAISTLYGDDIITLMTNHICIDDINFFYYLAQRQQDFEI